MTCSNCGTENPAGRKFCGACGAPLAIACPVCGAAQLLANVPLAIGAASVVVIGLLGAIAALVPGLRKLE